MTSFRAWAVAAALALVGCGEGGIRSPDFAAELISLSVTPSTTTVALGETVQYTAIGTFSTPPGSGQDTVTRNVTNEVSWSVSDGQRASINDAGLASTLAQGTVTVAASLDGKSDDALLTIGAARLTGLVVTPDSATIPLGRTQTFRAQGIFTNSTTPQELPSNVQVTWASGNTGVATVSPTQGVQTVATSQATGVAPIQASTPNPQGGAPLTDTATLTVGVAELVGLIRVEPQIATVAKGNSTVFVAIGEYSDGSEPGPLDNELVDWTSSNEAIATIAVDAEGDAVATGVEQGQATITATLKPGVPSATSQRSANATLNVTFAGCTTPLRASAGATVDSGTGGLCLGCSVTGAPNVIDESDASFATMQIGISAVAGTVTITVTSPTAFEAGQRAGFIVGRPAGQLLNAEVAASLSVSTLNNGTPTDDSASASDPLGLTLLGTVLSGEFDQDTALLSTDTTEPYNGIRLTFDAGLLTALKDINVFAACGDAQLPAAE